MENEESIINHRAEILLVFFQENLNQLRHVEIERMAFSALFAAAMIAALALVKGLNTSVTGYAIFLAIFFTVSMVFWFCAFRLCCRWNMVFDNHRETAKNLHDQIKRIVPDETKKTSKGLPDGLLFPFSHRDGNQRYTRLPYISISTSGLFVVFYWILAAFNVVGYGYYVVQYVQTYIIH